MAELQPPSSFESLLLRPAEAARLLSVGRSTLYELIARGDIPGVIRIGSAIRISRRALEGWIERTSSSARG